MKVKFNNSDTFVMLKSVVIYRDMVDMRGDNLKWNLSGFKLFEDDEERIIKDCSDHIYKWNIHTEIENGVVLTKNGSKLEPEPNINAEKAKEVIDPLTNDELTGCVADLMYEIDLIKLGVEQEE